ncbi:hypothetical protein AA0473_1939 [Acetobacter orleanensis NRIC 0473]|uniref:Uncharacterized protein n=1 Tax=Acetobacter orleanensis TaxID=104099 RepID=A0A4Y3TKJ4_9PROT|nr:hypothetical protein CO710_09795 [Acetobacter orleanensis]GAN69629.1 hypothetical protein Abol_048_043 [Acetobacter orleanensis JCM 7639]GBR29114.1 hypothetical protein AA0473_1939 [Acetobacter orleanensis NRIC 0473]GEB83511.1 hypothetical protein AOR01nite_19880 [Acetobacter orleanensis]
MFPTRVLLFFRNIPDATLIFVILPHQHSFLAGPARGNSPYVSYKKSPAPVSFDTTQKPDLKRRIQGMRSA